MRKDKLRIARPAAISAGLLALLIFAAACENPTTTPDPGILYPPPNLVSFELTPREGFIEARFTRVATATNGYNIYWSSSGSPAGADSVHVPQPENQLVYYKIENLQNGVPYNVWAEALYPDGHSSLSASLSAAPRARPQAAPGAFTAYSNDDSLDFTWTPVGDADFYVVYCTTEAAQPNSGGATFYIDDEYKDVMGHISGLDNGSSYNVWIRAGNTSGISDFSAGPITGSPAAGAPSGSLRTLRLVPLDAGLRVEWNAVRGASGYELYYRPYSEADNVNGAIKVTETVNAGAGRISATITGLQNKEAYRVWVKTANGNLCSASANETPQPKPAFSMNDRLMVLGEATAQFPNAEAGKGDRLSRKQETALGDLVADSMFYWADKHKTTNNITKVDFAFVNGGVITGGLLAGKITVNSITQIMYADGMSYFTMTGTQIKTLFHDYVAKVRHDGGGGRGTGAFGQVSSQVNYIIDYNNDPRGGVISELTLNGQPFDDATEYTFITSSYLIETNDDGYQPLLLQGVEKKRTGKIIAEAVCEWIYDQNGEPIVPKTDGRIKLRNEVWQ